MTTDLDTEAAGTIMLLELVLVLGFVVPVLLPVTAAAMLLHGITFEICVQHQGAVLMHEARPPTQYLFVSLLLGVGLVLWMFAECGWAGSILVYVGVPLSSMLGGLAPELLPYLTLVRRNLGRRIDAPGLQVSLLEMSAEDSQEVEASGRTRVQTEFFDFDDESDTYQDFE